MDLLSAGAVAGPCGRALKGFEIYSAPRRDVQKSQPFLVRLMTVAKPGCWEARVEPFLTKYFYVLCVILVAIASVRIMSTYTALSLTIDEPNHFAAGLEYVGKHVYHYEPQHAPLSRALQALGPYLAGARPIGLPVMRDETLAVLAQSGNFDRMVFLMRLGNLPFFLLACLTVCLWSWHAFGKAVAVLSTGLFTLLPTMLADGGLVTTDMASAATVGAAFFASVFWAEKPTRRRALLMGTCTALAFLSKFTALGYLPVSLGLALVFYLAACWPGWLGLRKMITERAPSFVFAGAVMLFVVWAGYWFTVGEFRSHWLPAGRALLLPAPELFEGIRAVVQLNHKGHQGFLLGEIRNSGWWYYLPVALAVKTPIAFLILTVVGVVVCLRERDRPIYLLPIALCLGVLLPAMKSHLSVGIRYIDAVYIGLSMIAALGLRQLLQWSRRPLGSLLTAGVLLVWMVVSVGAYHPDYLTYFNKFAGRHPENVLVDSNLDWGQDLRLLAKRLNEKGVKEFSLYTLDGVKRRDYLEAWYHLPEINEVDPLVPSPGWTVIGVTFDKVLLPWDRLQKGDAVVPWWDKMTPTERVGGLMLYYVPAHPTSGQTRPSNSEK